MLGGAVAGVLERLPGVEVTRGGRGAENLAAAGRYLEFDARHDDLGALLDTDDYGWIVNAIGILRARLDPHSPASLEDAVAINALFPFRLAAEAARRKQRVIQIATDGVFSGRHGPYDESAPHDAVDAYGKTKSLGEVPAANVVHLRCSIVGLDPGEPRSLLSRMLSCAAGSELTGYADQRWNGITTLHFGRLCAGLIAGASVPSPQHVVPADAVTKAELLELALEAFGRDDVSVRRTVGPEALDRTLSTLHPEANRRLWAAAGYERPPTIAQMLLELAAHERGALDAVR